MSHPEEFGEKCHQDVTGFVRRYRVWADIDPETFKVERVYYLPWSELEVMMIPPIKGYTPRECTDCLKRTILQHVRDTIAASEEFTSQEEDVIDDEDSGLPQNVLRLH